MLRVNLLLYGVALSITTQCQANCPASDRDVQKSGQALFLAGDRNIFLIGNTGTDIEKHCSSMRKHIAVGMNYARCQNPFPKQVVALLFHGLKTTINKECESKEWHKEFLEVSQCLKKDNKVDSIHSCMDTMIEQMIYAIAEFPPENQLSSTCCVYQLGYTCLRNTLANLCGPKVATFFTDHLDAAIGRVLRYICSHLHLDSVSKCDKAYLPYMSKLRFVGATAKPSNMSLIELRTHVILRQNLQQN